MQLIVEVVLEPEDQFVVVLGGGQFLVAQPEVLSYPVGRTPPAAGNVIRPDVRLRFE